MAKPDVNADRPILVTGGSGFVGHYLLRELAAQGINKDAIVTTSHAAHPVEGARETYQLDLTHTDAISQLVSEVKPSAIVHLAAIAAPADARRNKDAAWAVNFEGTRQLASAVLASVPDARFVFVGSAEAYGETFNSVSGLVSETAALQPATAYGATKAAAEIMISQMVHDGLDAICTRSFNHTGLGQTADYVVPAFASQIAMIEAGKQTPVLKVGNLDAARDFLDVRDVVRAYALLALGEIGSTTPRCFNVCSGKARTIQSVLDTLLAMAKVDISVESDPERMRPSDVPHAAGDNGALQAAFGWSPSIAFESTLEDTLNAFRAQYAS